MWSVAGSGSSATPSRRRCDGARAARPSSAASGPWTSRRRSSGSRRPLIETSRSTGSRARERVCAHAGTAPARTAASTRRRPGRRPGSASPAPDERSRPMLAIAAEELVGPLARKGDRDVPRGELAEREEPERRQVGKRLVEMPDELFEVDGVLGERQLELVVVGFERFGDEARIARARSGSPASAKPDGERLDRLAHVPRHQGDDQARVEPAAQHRAERHVAHQAQPNATRRASRAGARGIRPRFGRAPTSGCGIAPEALRAHPAVLDDERVPGHELRDAGERGVRPGEEAEGQIRVDRLVVEGRRRPARTRAGS